LDTLVRDGKLAIVGAFYDVKTGQVRFYKTANSYPTPLDLPDLEVELQQKSAPAHQAAAPGDIPPADEDSSASEVVASIKKPLSVPFGESEG
jgi:hypothetical protein